MARPKKFASMSVDALLQLRDDIGAMLSRKGEELQRQLAALTGPRSAKTTGRGQTSVKSRKTSLKGRKVEPKFKGPDGELWAGRGATPRWMTEALKGGRTKEEFLIAKGAGSKKPSTRRSTRRKKAAVAAD